MCNGTFVVFRQLRQHVGRFRQYLDDASQQLGVPKEILAERMMGRRKDGTPLVEHRLDDAGKPNHFGYGDDPHGNQCPLSSHVRRTHPRDAGGRHKTNAAHRIIRRGMTYGSELPAGARDDDSQQRGLLLIAMNTNLERQFEFIQRRWIDGSTKSGLDADKDPVCGSNTGNGQMIIQGDARKGRAPIILTGLPRFVTCVGGQYFFMPGILGLQRLLEQPTPIRRIASPQPTGAM
jgi:Dyp-type peroxidase family